MYWFFTRLSKNLCPHIWTSAPDAEEVEKDCFNHAAKFFLNQPKDPELPSVTSNYKQHRNAITSHLSSNCNLKHGCCLPLESFCSATRIRNVCDYCGSTRGIRPSCAKKNPYTCDWNSFRKKIDLLIHFVFRQHSIRIKVSHCFFA